MTWQEVLDSGAKTVTVESYGYTERNVFGSHFEPFAHKREFIFNILEFSDGFAILNHKWLNLEEPEEDLFFEEKDGIIYLDDPDLWTRELSALETLKSVLMRLGRNTIIKIVYTETNKRNKMNSFQILNKNGEALTMQELDTEAAAFWGKQVDDKKYAYPGELSTEKTFKASMHNEMIKSFNWFDIIGWSIATQNDKLVSNTWKNVVHTMVVEDLGEKLVSFSEEFSFVSFTDGDECHLNDDTEYSIYNYMELYKPMLALINHWAAKGYTPKQIKEN